MTTARAFGTLASLCGTMLLVMVTSLHLTSDVRAGTRPAATPQSAPRSSAAPHSITTWEQVAPILYGNCTTCHHPHGSGPFSLLSYGDARRWGTQVAQVTASHYMPPWLPAHGYGDFADERVLRQAQIDTLAAWVKAGMPEGNPAKAPPQPVYNTEWVGGEPDLILTVEQPFALPASGSDLFHNFILPFPLSGTHYIRAMEIRPSAPEVVHHANVLIDRTASLRRQHLADWQAGVEGMELNIDAGNTFDPDGHFLFWKADTPLLTEPPGMAWQLDGGSDLVLNMHLKPSGRAMLVTAQIGLYFTPDPPTQQPMLLQLEHDRALDIAAGDPHFVVEDHLTLPGPVSLLGIYPHAHYLGKDLQGWAMLPDGRKRWLIWIRDWDIDRQAVYRFREPVTLPRGSTVYMRYSYDNSAANPHNPHLPPVRVQAGNRSVDEMGHLWLQVLPQAEPGDKLDPRLLLEEAWMRRRLEKDPGDSVARYNLGSALEGEGRFKEAATTFQSQLARNGSDARSLNGLGGALEGEGDWQAASKAYERAIDTTPDDCDARFDLARLELKHALPGEAESQFRAMLSRCPEDAAVHSGLGTALSARGQDLAAEDEFRKALQIDATDFSANYALGVKALEANQLDVAVSDLSRAVTTNGRDLDAREHLALAFAQSGRLQDAATQLRQGTRFAPDDAALHALLSQVLAATGDLQEALQEQTQSVKLQPNDPDQWNNLGVLDARLGKSADAAADFRHALRLKPGDAQAEANLQRLQGNTAQAPAPR